MSLASEPELAKNTLPTGNGETSFSFSASAMAGSWLLPAEEVAERHLAHLLGGDIGELVLAPAERGAPQPRHRLDVILALLVIDAHALPVVEDHRPRVAECFIRLV